MVDIGRTATEERPLPSEVTTSAQLLRWYWLKTELVDIARRLEVGVGGSKEELTAAVAAALDGRPVPKPAVRRRESGQQLAGALTADTVIPPGQRCSQPLRAFFIQHIGAHFRFDDAMRSFIAEQAGATLGDAVAHWHATRTSHPRAIDGQFELNRFTRQWYADHPDGSRGELQQAWTTYRDTPTDRRSRA